MLALNKPFPKTDRKHIESQRNGTKGGRILRLMLEQEKFRACDIDSSGRCQGKWLYLKGRALPGDAGKLTTSLSSFTVLPLAGPSATGCGHGQGSDRACVMLDYSLHSEQWGILQGRVGEFAVAWVTARNITSKSFVEWNPLPYPLSSSKSQNHSLLELEGNSKGILSNPLVLWGREIQT